MKSFFLAFSLTFITLGFLSSPAFAQQDQNEDASLLPSIDPQNIEIRGEFRARFPGLQRQPILGFDPSMRIYQVPADRQPFMETGADVVANLPVSEFSRPAPPVYTPFNYSNINYLFTRVGYGSYSSPQLQLWGAYPLNEGSYIGGDINYTASTEGHLAMRPSEYRYLTANAEFGTQLSDNTELYLYAGMQNDFNYAAQFRQNNDFGNIARIEFDGVNVGAELSHFTNEITGWMLQGNVHNFTTTFISDSFAGEIDEWVYSGSFGYQMALGRPGETISLELTGRGGTYEPPEFGTLQWSTLQGGIVYERLFNYNTNLYAEADLFYTSNYIESSLYIGGLFKISHWFGSRLKVTGSVEGKPYIQTIKQNHKENRFLGYNNRLQHTYALQAGGKASLKYYRGSTLNMGASYLNAQDYSYYLPESINPDTGTGEFDFYSLNYQDATNIKLFAGITHQLLPEKFWINAQAYLQNPLLSNQEPIPYQENWGLNASATFRLIDRITIKGWANYAADREPGLPETELDNIFLVGGQLDITIVNGIGAYVKVINLLDQQYQFWQGYYERPLQLYGGLTIKL